MQTKLNQFMAGCLIAIALLTVVVITSPMSPVYAQKPNRPASFIGNWEALPQYIPATMTSIAQRDVYITEITITNSGVGNCFVEIDDGNGVPFIPSNYFLAPGQVIITPLKDRHFPKGIQWKACLPNVISASITGHL